MVLADPPWNFRTRSAKGRNRCPDGQGALQGDQYADIKALPVGALTAPDSALSSGSTTQGSAWNSAVGRCDARALRDRAAGRDRLRRAVQRLRGGAGHLPSTAVARSADEAEAHQIAVKQRRWLMGKVHPNE